MNDATSMQVTSVGEELRQARHPLPAFNDGDVRATVILAGINPLDARLVRGEAGRIQLPFTPGIDCVARVDGERFAIVGGGLGQTRAGSYATHVVVSGDDLVPIPSVVADVDAAAIGLPGVTAWGLVHKRLAVTDSDRVLVLGSSGSVAAIAGQLCRAAGAAVSSHVSNSEQSVAVPEGHTIIANDPESLLIGLKEEAPPTVVIDGLGGGYTVAALRHAATGARFGIYGVSSGSSASVDLGLLYRKQASLLGFGAFSLSQRERTQALQELLGLLAAGRLRVRVGAVLPLAEASQGQRLLEERLVDGRVLLRP